MTQFTTDAEASAAAYQEVDKRVPPAGYRNATDADLAKLGLDRSYIENPVDRATGKVTEFRAAVFINETTNDPLVAFRGTASWEDVGVDKAQALGEQTFHYTRAQDAANRIANSPAGKNVRFTGHSLGAGLASAAARATGAPASSFNAAGLNAATVADPHMAAAIDAVYVRGEALTSLQHLPGLPSAAATQRWPLDPPPSIGAAVLTAMAGALGGYAGLGTALAIRSGMLHKMDNVQDALAIRSKENTHAIAANGC